MELSAAKDMYQIQFTLDNQSVRGMGAGMVDVIEQDYWRLDSHGGPTYFMFRVVMAGSRERHGWIAMDDNKIIHIGLTIFDLIANLGISDGRS